MDKQRFMDRYMRFWRHFHPNIQPQKNLKETALGYCQMLTDEKVSYEKFDEICTLLQKETKADEMQYSFNLVAYVLDYIRSEYQEKMEWEGSAQYIPLPQKRTPLGQIDIEKLKPSLAILKRNCPNLDMLGMLERINTLRAQGHGKEDRYCQSCSNTGYVYVGEKEVACCQCAKGTFIYNNQGDVNRSRMATYKECQSAAKGESLELSNPF